MDPLRSPFASLAPSSAVPLPVPTAPSSAAVLSSSSSSSLPLSTDTDVPHGSDSSDVRLRAFRGISGGASNAAPAPPISDLFSSWSVLKY